MKKFRKPRHSINISSTLFTDAAPVVSAASVPSIQQAPKKVRAPRKKINISQSTLDTLTKDSTAAPSLGVFPSTQLNPKPKPKPKPKSLTKINIPPTLNIQPQKRDDAVGLSDILEVSEVDENTP